MYTGLDRAQRAVPVTLGALPGVGLLFAWDLFPVSFPAGARALGAQAVNLVDQILLILLVIELLYTVQVSFRERGLTAEPFLVVALIAVIRRVLVLTAQVPELPGAGEAVFRHAMRNWGYSPSWCS